MGLIYEAHDQWELRKVAVKLLDHDGPDRFEREGRVLASLNHPGIVKYITHGSTALKNHYLVMEWLEGEDLSLRLKRGPLSEEQALQLAGRIASALAAAHENGIVHRDIKPSNIFLRDGDPADPVLLDFGVAQLGNSTLNLTGTGTLLGTPCYMAPEQATGSDVIEEHADMFSLGSILFECLTGRQPFVGQHVFAVLAKIVFDQPPHVREFEPTVSAATDNLVAALMRKSPANRPSASELSQRLYTLSNWRPSRIPESTTRLKALTHREHRLISVILTRAPQAFEAGPQSFVESDATATTTDAGPDAATRRDASLPSPNAELRRVLEAARERYDAQVEWFVDGSALALLTRAGSAAELATGAARLALELRRMVPSAPVAIATGRTLLEERVALGEVFDRAANLARSAEAGIRLDEATTGLLPSRFEVGFEAGVSCLLRERDVDLAARAVLGRQTACIGRERELSVLRGVYDECVEDSVPRAALVTGASGMGKSRLRYEFVRRLELEGKSFSLLIGQGDPLRTGSPLALLVQGLRRFLGLLAGESARESRRKLRESVAERVPADKVAVNTEFLGELLGTPVSSKPSELLQAARRDASLMRSQMQQALATWLACESLRQPLVILLDDLHWSDPESIEFIEELLRELNHCPIFVFALARTGIHESYPELWQRRNLQEIRLSGLRPRSCVELARSVLGPEADADVIDNIVTRANGNAFYLEELIRAVAGAPSGELPATLAATVHARLEALPSGLRRVLRAASIFGETFWRGALERLLSEDVSSELAALEREELLDERQERRFAGDVEYTFHHDLVREVAYAALTPDDRAIGHRLAAQWLEQNGEKDAAVVAEHLYRGGELGPAATRFLRAGERRLADGMPENALASLRRADELGLPAEDQVALVHALTRAYRFTGDPREFLAWITNKTCEAPDTRVAAALAEAEIATLRSIDAVRVLDRADHALAILDDWGTPEAYAHILSLCCFAAYRLGDAVAVKKYADLASSRAFTTLEAEYHALRAQLFAAHLCAPGKPVLDLSLRCRDKAAELMDLAAVANETNNVATGLLEQGFAAKAEKEALFAINVAERAGHRAVARHARVLHAAAKAELGALDTAIVEFVELIDMDGAAQFLSLDAASIACVYLLERSSPEDLEIASKFAEVGAKRALAAGAQHCLLGLLAAQARVLLRRDGRLEARRLLSEARSLVACAEMPSKRHYALALLEVGPLLEDLPHITAEQTALLADVARAERSGEAGSRGVLERRLLAGCSEHLPVGAAT